MNTQQMIDLLSYHLVDIEQFKRSDLFELYGLDDSKGEAQRALWFAMEYHANFKNRRFASVGVGGGLYALASPAKRAGRAQARTRAAGRVLKRSLIEVRAIEIESLTPEQRSSLLRMEERLANQTMRARILTREASRKRPAGL